MTTVRGRVLGLGRGAAAFCVLLELLLLVATLSAGWPRSVGSWCFLAVLVAIAARTAFVGCYVDDRGIVVRSWLRTRRIERPAVAAVRPVAYSGFANRFSASRLLSMVAVEVVGRTLPIDLRFSADTPGRVRRRAALLADALFAR